MRLKNDYERADLHYRSRTLDPDWVGHRQTPQVIPIFLTPAYSSGGNRTPVGSLKGYIQRINGIASDKDRKWRYYVNDHSGYFNVTGWDKLELLGMGDNLVNVIEEFRGFMSIETLFLEDGPPDPQIINYENTPWLIHRFTVITDVNRVIDPPPGRIYSPLVIKRGLKAWIPASHLIEV
jgi:hypothetical protein